MDALDHWTYTYMGTMSEPAKNELDELANQIADGFRVAKPSTVSKIPSDSTFNLAEYIWYVMHINPNWWSSRLVPRRGRTDHETALRICAVAKK